MATRNRIRKNRPRQRQGFTTRALWYIYIYDAMTISPSANDDDIGGPRAARRRITRMMLGGKFSAVAGDTFAVTPPQGPASSDHIGAHCRCCCCSPSLFAVQPGWWWWWWWCTTSYEYRHIITSLSTSSRHTISRSVRSALLPITTPARLHTLLHNTPHSICHVAVAAPAIFSSVKCRGGGRQVPPTAWNTTKP